MIFRAGSLFIMLLFGGLYYLMRINFQESTIHSEEREIVAAASKSWGDVRVKKGTAREWENVSQVTTLSKGDLVFVGNASAVTIDFKKDSASLRLPAESLYEVTDSPLPTNRIQRNFIALYDGKKPIDSNKAGKTVFVKMQRMPGRDFLEAGSMSKPDVPQLSTLSYQRRAQVLGFTYPASDVEVISSSFPAVFAAEVDTHGAKLILNGYLWKKDGLPTPLWVGTSPGIFDAIPIAEPGNYLFQAISEDDSFVTPVLPVTVKRSLNETQLNALFKTEAKTSRTLFLR